MQKYKVYKIIFPNGKCYIGITSTKMSDRIKSHKSRIKDAKIVYPLYLAFRKYGFENVSWEVLYEDKTLQEAEEIETRLILETKPNYNAASGGQVHELTDDMRAKIGSSTRKRFENQENREQISKSLKEYYKTNPGKSVPKGTKPKEEVLNKIRAYRGKQKEETIKKILSIYTDGMKISTLCKLTGISDTTVYTHRKEWLSRYEDSKKESE